MSDRMRGRRPRYLDGYAQSLAAAYRLESIERDVEREQDRVQYLDSLIAQAEQVRASLQETFRVPPQDLGQAKALLKRQAELQGAMDIAAEAGQAARVRASSVPEDEMLKLLGLLKGQPGQAVLRAVDLIKKYPGAASKVVGVMRRAAVPEEGRVIRASLAGIEQAANQAVAPATGVPQRLQQQVEEARGAFTEALESSYMAGPSGIRGGFDGLELVNLRELTAAQLRERSASAEDEAQKARLEARAEALDESEFATGEEALEAALAVVRESGDPTLVEEDLARNMYEEARASQAYRNDQRADFEQEVLDARRRVAGLRAEKEKLAGAYDDPRQEILRRDLRARGYDIEDPYIFEDGEYKPNPNAWRNGYVRYQNTPEYDFYIQAHERVNEATAKGKRLAPTTRAENVAVSFTMMRDRRGEGVTPQQLAAQLGKAGIKGKELQDAVSFTMAYWELGGPNQDPEVRKQDQERQREEEKARRDAAQAVADRAQEAQQDLIRREQQATLAAEATLGFREARTAREDARRIYAQEYQRQRVLGKSPEEAARSATSRVQKEAPGAPTAPVEVPRMVSQQLGGPEALVARQAPVTRAPMQVEGMTIRAERPTFQETAIRVQDPTAPEYSYARTDDGFKVFRGDVETGIARPGTTAFRSIERTLAGGQPLPPAPPPAPAPAAPAPAAPAPAAAPVPDFEGMTDEELEAYIQGQR